MSNIYKQFMLILLTTLLTHPAASPARAADDPVAAATKPSIQGASVAHKENLMRYRSATRLRSMLLWLPVEAAVGGLGGGAFYAIARHLNFSKPLVAALLIGAGATAVYASLIKYVTWRAEDDYLRREIDIERTRGGSPPAAAPAAPAPEDPGFDGLERTSR